MTLWETQEAMETATNYQLEEEFAPNYNYRNYEQSAKLLKKAYSYLESAADMLLGATDYVYEASRNTEELDSCYENVIDLMVAVKNIKKQHEMEAEE